MNGPTNRLKKWQAWALAGVVALTALAGTAFLFRKELILYYVATRARDATVVLANRDGIRVERYDQVHPERRTGYSWYGSYAAELISSTYPAWHCRVLKMTPAGVPCS